MPATSADLVREIIRITARTNAVLDVQQLACELQHHLPELPRGDILALIDAAVIAGWGAAAVPDRSAEGQPT